MPVVNKEGTRWSVLSLIPPSYLSSIAINPDGNILASGGYGSITLWDMKSGKVIRHLEGHSGKVRELAFDLKGELLISGGSDSLIIAWKYSSGEILKKISNTSEVDALAVTPDSEVIAASDDNGQVRMWNLQTGNFIRSLKDKNGENTQANSIAISPDGKVLAHSGGEQLNLWLISTGKLQKVIKNAQPPIAITPDGSKIISSTGWGGKLSVWDIKTGDSVLSLNTNSKKLIQDSFSVSAIPL